ncbi:sigma 54-interacting transcriptional regulator [Lawsonibacter sp. DFI.6.74]|nr:sigma 54-interacting transcriptional regulator [Lawsonibacter sp. DFI.6.74]MCG4772703.1 sigma 54-interacting transcriptional regulator [Lawsonibacter sp. DFI.5.51]
MKRIAVIAYSLKTSVRYADRLRSLFGSCVEVVSYALEKGIAAPIQADVALISAHSIYGYVEEKLAQCQYLMIADLTLYQEAVDQLRALPRGSRAMLVNSTMEMAVETIRLIHNAGIKHIEMTPFYPGIAVVPDVPIAITPGEFDLVPPDVPQIVDLKDRTLSMHTVINLAAKLGMTDMLQSPQVQTYAARLATKDSGIGDLIDRMQEQKKKLELVMEVFDGGVISLSGYGIISFLNPVAEVLLDTHPAAVGQPLVTLLPELKDIQFRKLTAPVKDIIIERRGQMVDVSVYPLGAAAASGEFILMLKTIEDMEEGHERMRRQIKARGFNAKYSFSSIKTQSPKMLSLMESAKKMAASSSSIVIHGQSGTGKELFAQAIHNASPRREYPFIAINCASIPESLLESELFGYSEGAFTGAKKGGKKGYFELANQGTLFLDEIGEMDLNLQARILRVLQEKEITRVGGDRVFSIDVRVISASNKRLLQMVRRNLFREDLYYRLNVLSLEIPPLKERREDIPLLLEEFQTELHTNVQFTPQAVGFLQAYPWNGNVRELRNFAERVSYLGHSQVTAEDARALLDCEDEELGGAGSDTEEQLMYLEPARRREYLAILAVLDHNGRLGLHQGRMEISRSLAARGVSMTETQVRTALQSLQRYGCVHIWPGRRGTELTADGKEILEKLAEELAN